MLKFERGGRALGEFCILKNVGATEERRERGLQVKEERKQDKDRHLSSLQSCYPTSQIVIKNKVKAFSKFVVILRVQSFGSTRGLQKYSIASGLLNICSFPVTREAFSCYLYLRALCLLARKQDKTSNYRTAE